MQQSDDAIIPACQLAWRFLHPVNPGRAQRFHNRIEQQINLQRHAAAERNTLNVTDTFLPSDLDDSILADLIEQIHGQLNVKQLWIARKQVQYLRHRPLYLIVFKTNLRLDYGTLDVAQQLADLISLPGTTRVINKNGRHRETARMIIQQAEPLF